jgi:hexosaminidase
MRRYGHLSMRIAAALPLLVTGIVFAAQPALMPWPSHIEQSAGVLSLSRPLRIKTEGCDARVARAIERFRTQLSLQTGDHYRHMDVASNDNPELTIHCAATGQNPQELSEDESYSLSVGDQAAKIDAPTPLGAMHGLQTLLQLVEWGPQGWDLPVVEVHDSPRFAWRGLMIDSVRHFIPLDEIERNIDGMAAVKLNTLHMHLSDDEGFRIESRKAPKLQKVSSDGEYYSQAQIKELVEYARDRGIRVVPEFDVPGHSTCWTVAYPELASATAPTRLVRNGTDVQQPPLDPTNEKTYKLLDKVFGEMAKLFPDAYFHIGGDEVDGKYWDQEVRIQTWMKKHDIKDDRALQAYFNQRLQKIVAKHGKHMEGWDEILAPELPRGTLVQSWRGAQSLADAAKQGFPTILSAGWYLDLMYSASYHYAVEPLSGASAQLSAEEQKHILGGEAAQWAEYITPEVLDNRLWPRLAAIAERLWSPATVTDTDQMYARLDRVSTELEWLGLRHRSNQERMLARLVGTAPKELVFTLIDTLEPVKEYDREQTERFDADRPLNAFADALSPESDSSRRANDLATRALTDAAARANLRELLTRWRDNDAKLQPYLQTSQPLASIAPFSPVLSQLGGIGLAALDSIEQGRHASAEEHAQHLAVLKGAEVHHAELLMAVTTGVTRLVEAETVSQ